jgi:ketosteroid isomerase-like protein
MTRSALLPLALALAAAGSVSQAKAQAAVDTAAAKAGITALRTQYATLQKAGDVSGLAGLYTDMATLDAFGAPSMHGRAAVEAGLKAQMAARKYTVAEITPTMTAVRTNEAASEIGTYHDMYEMGGKLNHEWGRYVVGNSKGSDGQWRINYLMTFPDSTKAVKKTM